MTPEPTLPALRQELNLLEGPTGAQGEPTWLIHDAVRNAYFRLDWVSFALLSHWSDTLTASALLAEVQAQGRVQVGQADVVHLLQFLQHNQLLAVQASSAAKMAHNLAQRKGSVWKWLLHNYLFFRIPIIKPDRFLSATLGAVDFVFQPWFWWLSVAAGVLGLFGVWRQSEVFWHTLVDSFSWQGMFAYGLTLAFIKILHEFGHGYTAKRHGCQVPTMGLAFLVLWPVLYTDTNDVWRLRQHRQRLQVSSAGILTELNVALWATLAWVLLPNGVGRSMVFLLATTTWISTLLINVSPFMRFDGYFILMDALGFANLHPRSFALARWRLRRWLWRLPDPAPEVFPPRQQTLLVLFAWLVWLYRLSLFLGIAALVYHFFIKVVGICLFLVEIVWFVAQPVWSEIKVWRERMAEVGVGRKWLVVTLGSAALALLLWLPLPQRVVVSGLVIPNDYFTVYAPKGAMLLRSPTAATQAVAADEAVFEFKALQLDHQDKLNSLKQGSAQWQSNVASLQSDTLGQWSGLSAQSQVAVTEVALTRTDLSKYRVHAPFAATVHAIDPEVQSGQWLPNAQPVAHLVGQTQGFKIVTYLPEAAVSQLPTGALAVFASDSGAGPRTALRLESIDTDASRLIAEPELVANFGGHVLVREHKGQFFPEGSYYRATWVPTPPPDDAQWFALRWRGVLYIQAQAEPLAWGLWRSGLAVLVREFGF